MTEDARTPAHKHKVVIVGGGFGGLYAAKALRRAAVELVLVDKRNFHLFQPLLYQVATGTLSPGEIASPLRYVLRRSANSRVMLAEATDVDVAAREVITDQGPVGYDTLVVATGAGHTYFGHPEWEALAPGLKTIEDATEIRRRVFLAFESAEMEDDLEWRQGWLTFVIVGAGPTGVELAGALSEIAHETLRHDFRRIDLSQVRIVLLDGAPRALPGYPEDLSQATERSLRTLAVEMLPGTMVTNIEATAVTARRGEIELRIETRTVLWAAGVQGSALGKVLAQRAGAPLDRLGRVVVEPDLTVPGHAEIFVIGDLASFTHQGGVPLPGVAQVAMQQGQHVASAVARRLRGEIVPAFHYADRGSMATIGRNRAVARVGSMHFHGRLAWLMWVFVHVLYLVEFENRLLVLVQWAWSYITWNRGARLITGRPPPPSGQA